MILAMASPPACLTATCALRMARVWILTKSGIIRPRRTPRRPSIGFCSCIDWTIASSSFCSGGRGVAGLGDLDERLLEVGQELVQRRVDEPDHHGQALHGLEDALEVALLELLELAHGAFERVDGGPLVVAHGLSPASALARARMAAPETRMAPRTISSRSPSRNMCSVRQRPMPSAP